MITTAFTELVGCEAAIQQAPMGAISPPSLAAAVARAGGVGTISVLPGTPAADLAAQIAAMTGPSGDAPGALAVNFLTDDADPELVELAASRVRLIDFFWSSPDRTLVDIAHESGAVTNWQVGSVAEAVAAADAGVDVVTAQGVEAGGHVRGHTSTLPLLVAVLDAVDVPVLAAGGIADARSVAAVLAAGAAGARIGTRFITAHESGAHPRYVSAILEAGPGATEITDEFAVCPLCATVPRARVLRSAVATVKAGSDVVGTFPTPHGSESIPRHSGMPPHRAVDGDVSAMALYAGQSTGSITEAMPAADIVRQLLDGAEDLLRAWA
jgi:NAD(P)H-dependent flavin oxidoreductase YrpB (nitropropane dioxygenase family)